MIFLYILLGLILLIFIALLIPVRFQIKYEDSPSFIIKYLFLSYDLNEPEELESVEGEAEDEAEQVGGRFKKMFEKTGLSGFLSLIKEILSFISDAGRFIYSKLKIRYFDLDICIGGEDAAEIALTYGGVSAAVCSFYGVLFNSKSCKKKKAAVNVDFKRKDSVVKFECEVSLRMLPVAFKLPHYIKLALPIVRKYRSGVNKKSEDSQNPRQSKSQQA